MSLRIPSLGLAAALLLAPPHGLAYDVWASGNACGPNASFSEHSDLAHVLQGDTGVQPCALPGAAGLPGQNQSAARADLGSGRVGTYTWADSTGANLPSSAAYVLGAGAHAEYSDFVHFARPAATPGLPVPAPGVPVPVTLWLGIEGHFDGFGALFDSQTYLSVRSDDPLWGIKNAELHFTWTGLGSGSPLATATGFGFGYAPGTQPANLIGLLKVSGLVNDDTVLQIDVAQYAEVDVQTYGRGLVDFLHTATLAIDVPEGWTVSSDSGVLLSVDEPTQAALLLSGLLVLGWRRRRALAALALAGTATLGHAADALSIDRLAIVADTQLVLQGGPTSIYSGSQIASNADALMPPAVVAANAADPWHLSFALASQANNGWFRTRLSTVNAYPDEASGFHPYDPVLSVSHATAGYELSVGALVPDAPLQMTVDIWGGHLAISDYYAAGQVDVSLKMQLDVAFDGGPYSPAWQWQVGLSLGHSGLQNYPWTISTPPPIDPQGIGAPFAGATLGYDQFAVTGRLEIHGFRGQLDFGLLQPGHTFQMRYVTTLTAQGNFPYAGILSGYDADLIDPVSLGGAAVGPITIAGLTLPSPVPEAPSAALLAAGLWLLLRRRSRGG